MTIKVYTVLGWLVWQVIKLVTAKKLSQKRAKVGAAGLVALVLVGGVAAAKAGLSDDDS
jgi:hypothetical protein